MSGGGTQKSFRKAFGAIKDSTTVGIAKVNSGYKELDIAIVKATNHLERPAKEKFIRAIFGAISATRPRADVAYCIHALARRLAKTKNWAVALKTLIVIHRALREVDPTFHEELVNYGKSRSHMLNLAHFKDDSSSNAWDYSSWVRTYALFLEERLECFRILKYDIATERSRTKDLETEELLEHLTILQQLHQRAISCQPEGAAVQNPIIHLALSMVFLESMRIHEAVSDGTVNLIDKFFEMQRSDAVKALSIYRRAGQQAEKLSEFFEVCKNMNVGCEEKLNKIEQPLASFIQAMEEYIRDAPRSSITRKDEASDGTLNVVPRVMLAIEPKATPEVHKETSPPPPPPPPPPPQHSHTEPEPEQIEVGEAQPHPVLQPPTDLLGMIGPTPDVSELDEKNALSLAIVPVGPDQPPTSDGAIPAMFEGGATGWELALVATNQTENSGTINKLGGGFDKLTLDSLYDDAIRRSGQADTGFDHWQHQQKLHDPFFTSPLLPSAAASLPPQMPPFSAHQHTYMWQQQQQQQQQHMQLNPFGSPYGGLHSFGLGQAPTNNSPYRGLI